jgi:hypothetical protein
MGKQLTFKIYKLELATGKIHEGYREFESIMDAKNFCFVLNTNSVQYENIECFYFYSFYSDFQAFNSQEDLKCFALNKLEAWNDELNKLKALYMVATKSLLQGGLNKKEAV